MTKPLVHINSIVHTLAYLAQCEQDMPLPMGNVLAHEYQRDPFVMLIGCLLSLRARDIATYPVCTLLFSQVRTPQALLAMDLAHLENILRPIGFFHKKAWVIRKVCQVLIDHFDSKVPEDLETLLSLPGVGSKTANFMLCFAFNRPAICVDTHVQRLTRKFGWVKALTPEETEKMLREIVPQEWWCRLNTILVQWGQHVCKPRLSAKEQVRHMKLCPCAWDK